MSTRSLYGKSIKRKKTAKSESKKTGRRRRKTSSVTKKKIGIKRKKKEVFFITTMMYSSETDKSTPLVHTENVASFAKPPINTGEEKVMWVLHEPCFVSKEHYSSVQFYISGTGTQYTDLSRTELYVRLKIENSAGNVLKEHNALYPYQKTDVRTKHLAKGSYGETLEDIYQGQVSSRLIVGFVESEAYNGSFS